MAPARAYDHVGQRIFFGTDQNVDCSVDHAGIPTEVSSSGNERWLGVFLRFDRLLSDPRTDGNSQQVFFRRDESFEIVVRQAAEGPIGAAPKVPLVEDELLVCDVLRRAGQTQILNADIDTSRRQAFIFAQGDAVEIISGLWSILHPAVDTVQSALDEVDAELADHFGGSARRHPASDIDYTPHGFVGSGNVQEAIDEMIDDLSSAASGSPGASRVGADAASGTPHALPAGNVDVQLSQLLAWLNDHVSKPAGAHNASAIAAAAHNYITGASVQAQLQEIVDDLQSQSSSLGASQVGDAAISGSPKNLSAGTVRQQLASLLGHINTHIGAADHDGRYYTKSQADSRYYNVGEKVGDADTLDGHDSSYFATAGHDHDDRYLRRVYSTMEQFDPGDQKVITTLEDAPDLVTVSYNYPDSYDLPQATTYVNGALTPDIRCWVTKIDMGGGDKDYRITVRNGSSSKLWINVAAYGRG